jgi:acyl-CoA hydrolase
MSRILNENLRSRIMTAEDAASLITSGSTVGMTGFTGSGYRADWLDRQPFREHDGIY